jgi:anaerobic selenocysteine-containing dehydrogenase
MNGQPTAQNTRETGADGDLSGMRNWDNQAHVHELAELWRVDPMTIPHWAPPTHAMQIWRYAEQGSIELLWITATNPAVSLPELARVREILKREELMVVVQDMFLTETAELADVVLPAAGWGEKLGTFTNADRTVHISERAVDPPGEARSDLDIFLDYAQRMELRDKRGEPLVRWTDPEGAFEAWKECARGRPCDYGDITYEALRRGSGIQWGGDRLHGDGQFNTDSDYCEDYGHDLRTGAAVTEEQHRALAPAGRAFLRAAEYEPGPETPDDNYPLTLTTGRSLYQFHTRTKTSRAPELQAAAPDAWVELNPDDAQALGITDGDRVRVESRRGAIEVPARVNGVRRGAAFVPFHYGDQAANELTQTAWDPVSKQPIFKVAAVKASKR